MHGQFWKHYILHMAGYFRQIQEKTHNPIKEKYIQLLDVT